MSARFAIEYCPYRYCVKFFEFFVSLKTIEIVFYDTVKISIRLNRFQSGQKRIIKNENKLSINRTLNDLKKNLQPRAGKYNVLFRSRIY